MLGRALALDGVADVGMGLVSDEASQAVALSEAVHRAGAVLPDAAAEVACHAEVERAVGAVGDDVDVAAAHGDMGAARRRERQAFLRRHARPCAGYSRPAAAVFLIEDAAMSRRGWPGRARP